MTTNPARDRLFYSLPSLGQNNEDESKDDKNILLSYIRNNIVGRNKQFSGPFGLREAVYLDYTASGKSLSFIEDYIRDQVLPEYGNTHTTSNVTSLQTTLYRHEARDIVRNALHAGEHDAVIFVGSGSTAAVHKLIHALNLKSQPAPVVFVSPYEHHSNLLPWKEVGAKVLRVKADEHGQVDEVHLLDLLIKWKNCGRQLIGCFSAASNITGILVDVNSINILLHKHGALAFWDYATAAPYVQIDMNPVSSSTDQPYMYKDAVFISCHKFVGGVQTPGILIAKKSLFRNNTPGGCGGGSVFYVRRDDHRYLQEPELKEEGGTPAIIESIRAGLVFQLKQAVSTRVIMDREEYMFGKARDAWKDHPSLILLGNTDVQRLPIFSFLVYNKEAGRFLHHNFVSVLLNDLFGIQARGGCACAGPYAMDLLGMEEETSKQIENVLAEDSRLDRTHLRRYREYSQREIIRPGFTRINLPYFMDDETLEFVIEAVKIVAEEGWKLLPQYMFNPETGEWRQVNFQVFKDRKWLGHISYAKGAMMYKVPPPVIKGPLPDNYEDCLQKARALCTKSSKSRYQLADHTVMFDEESRKFRWFVVPSEASDCLQGNELKKEGFVLPFCPPLLRKTIGMSKFVENYDDDDENDVAKFTEESDICRTEKEVLRDETNSDENKKPAELFSEGFANCVDRGFVCRTETFQESAAYDNTNDDQNLIKDDTCDKSSSKDMEESVQIVPEGPGCSNTRSDISPKCDNSSDTNPGTSYTRSDLSPECDNSSDTIFINESCKDDYQVNTDTSEKRGNDCSTLEICRNRKAVETATDEVDKPDHRSSVVLNGDADKSGTNHTRDTLSDTESTSDENAVIADADDSSGALSSRKRHVDQETTETGDNQVKKVKETVIKKKNKKHKWCSPSKSIFTPFLKATDEFNMIRDGDRILVCLSGGKDSLSLLHTVHQYQFYCKKKNISFDLGAVTVDPQTPAYDPSPLKLYLASLGVPYFYESQGILEQASNLPYECASICSFCSRMKRGRIYACARRERYNVLALGQHLDDISESFMMSIFHNGNLRTMKAHYTVEDGDLRVIRPLVYVREKDLRIFAEQNKLPVIAENCPACFEAPKERHRIKQLLAAQEIMFPRIYPSMLSAIKPIMAISKTQIKLADMIQQQDNEAIDDIDI